MISVPNNLKVGHLSHCTTEDALNTLYVRLYGIRHMVKDQIAREETHCHHMGYSLRLAARFLLYAPSHKLHSVKPVLGEWQSSYRRCRKDEVVLCRARISHKPRLHCHKSRGQCKRVDRAWPGATFWWAEPSWKR